MPAIWCDNVWLRKKMFICMMKDYALNRRQKFDRRHVFPRWKNFSSFFIFLKLNPALCHFALPLTVNQVLILVICSWCLFHWQLYKLMFSFSFYFLAGWENCIFCLWLFLVCIFTCSDFRWGIKFWKVFIVLAQRLTIAFMPPDQ